MTNAVRDENRVPVALGTLDTDGTTVISLAANPTTHHISFESGVTGTDLGPVNSKRDDNRVTTWMGVSSDDGVTPVAVYFTSDGRVKVSL